MKQPPKLPENANQGPTVPLPSSNQDDAASITGWVGLAIALLILLLLLLFVALMAANRGGGSADGGVGSDDITQGDSSGGAGADITAGPGVGNDQASDPQRDSRKDIGSPASADSGASEDAGNDVASIESEGERVGEGDSSATEAATLDDDEPLWGQASTSNSAIDIPSGTVALGNISGRAEFFGMESGDGPVSYVIDYSGSMQGGRFDKAREHLVKCIKSIRSQEFNVFLYNDGFQSFNGGKLVSPSANNKNLFEQWIRQFYAGGGTRPVPAVRAAVQSGTKNIFLLSDGEFNQAEADEIIRLCNAENVRVNVCSLHAYSHTLRSIADGCQGGFRHIR